MNSIRRSLGVADYMVFALTLGVSAAIGIYFRFSGVKRKTTEDYLMAGKDMSILPVAFSLMASFKSAIAFLGYPSDIYVYGTLIVWNQIWFILGVIFVGIFFLQPYFDLKCSTSYEYLEKRFGTTIRRFGSLTFVVQMTLYMGVVLYAPALALSAVTTLSLWTSIIAIGVVCTLYCTMGGMKAVLWTDVFQSVIMFTGLFALIIKGITNAGGVKRIFEIADRGGRLLTPGYSIDFTTRYTFWNLIAQSFFMSMSTYGCGQIQIQRLLTIKDIKRSRRALYFSLPMTVAFMLLLSFVGLEMFATFHDCDPLTAPGEHIGKRDQLLPYFAMASFEGYPGLPGLCISSIFSASLSSVSSAVNSLTTVTLEDFIKPIFGEKPLFRKHSLLIAKLITLAYGAVCILGTFIISRFDGLLDATFTIFGMFGGPILGVFILGMFTARANEIGTLLGAVISTSFVAWISFGSAAIKIKHPGLPLSTEGCPANITNTVLATLMSSTSSTPALDQGFSSTAAPSSSSDDAFILYRISFMWTMFLGVIFSCIIGYISSLVTTLVTGKNPEVNPECLTPLMRKFLKPTVFENGCVVKEIKQKLSIDDESSGHKKNDVNGVMNAVFEHDVEIKQSTRF